MTTPQPNLLIRSAVARKTGLRAQGAIRYNVLADADRSELFFALVENQGGSGCYSKEAVCFTRIQQCVSGGARDKPFPSKMLKPAFVVGRGQNNAGYLAACLRHEKLLKAPEGACHGHLLAGDWDAWKLATLAEPGEPLVPTTAEAVTSTDDGAKADRAGKSRLRGKGPRHHPSLEDGDASAS